jgi:hypothetical protein
LFINQTSESCEFGLDQLDIKRKVMKSLNPSIALKLTFKPVRASDLAFDSKPALTLAAPPSDL